SPLCSSSPATTGSSTSTSALARRRWSGDVAREARCRRDRCVRRRLDGGPRDPRGGAMNAEASHYCFRRRGGGLFDLVFVAEDGTTELLAEGVDMQTALAISAGHAQSLREEEP